MTAGDAVGRRPARRPQPPLALLSLGIELLPTIEDDLDADLVERLLLALVHRDETLLAVRSVLSAALEHSHAVHLENSRLRRRLADLLDGGRLAGTAA